MTRPTVYDPNSAGDPVTISLAFEKWLTSVPKEVKDKVIAWIDQLLQMDTDDVYQDLLKETVEKERASLAIEEMDLGEASTSFSAWRDNPQVAGYENVAEISWLFQELQQGFTPFTELDAINYRGRLNDAVETRFSVSKASKATREKRLKAWIVCLNSY